MNDLAGIYLHIPFCASRCHYCNFATGGYESELAKRYVAALLQEIERAEVTDAMRHVDTIYFGGGTPTTLSIEQLDAILTACQKKFAIASTAEITTEANPGTISQDYFQGLRDIGFNRLSFGVQSFNGYIKSRQLIHQRIKKIALLPGANERIAEHAGGDWLRADVSLIVQAFG